MLVASQYWYPRINTAIKRRTRLNGAWPKVYSGNLAEIAKYGILDSTAKWMSQYGPTYICYYGIRPVITTQDLDIIKSVLVKNFDCFINRPYMPPLLRRANLQGIGLLHGEQWHRVCRIVTPTFTKRLKMMAPLIEESCERLRNKMAAVSDTGSTIDVQEWFEM